MGTDTQPQPRGRTAPNGQHLTAFQAKLRRHVTMAQDVDSGTVTFGRALPSSIE
jgi:hypothetical protein